MRNLLLFFIATICGAATLPLYIDTDTNSVVSPDAPTTLDGYGITDAVGGTPTLDAFLVGDGAAWVTQSGQTAQESLGIVNVDGGAVIGASSSAVAGGAVGFLAEATDGGAVGRNSSATDGGAVGRNAEATTGFAGGFLASAESGGAIGYLASADGPGRVQLGTGTNSTDSTIQFLNSGSVTAAEFGILSGADTDLTTLSLPANTTISTFGASLVDDADAAAANVTLGIVGSLGRVQVGDGSTAGGIAGTAIGNNSSASGSSSIAIGSNSGATAANSAQIGNGTNSTSSTIQFLSSGSVTAEEFGRLARMGFVDYNDASGDVSLTADTWTDVPNDTLGSFTNTTYIPSNVTTLIDDSTGHLDFTELELGQEISIRNDFIITPNTNNALLQVRYVLGTGANEYALLFWSERLDSGSGVAYQRVITFPIYMGDTNTRDNPGKLQVKLSTPGTLNNNGSYISIR